MNQHAIAEELLDSYISDISAGCCFGFGGSTQLVP